MEPFFDFGLFELMAITGVGWVVRRIATKFRSVRAFLGRQATPAAIEPANAESRRCEALPDRVEGDSKGVHIGA
jgi:hypothetical protein